MLEHSFTDQTLQKFFADALDDSLTGHLGVPHASELVRYLSELLVRFLHRDGIYSVRNMYGRPVTCVVEMMAEGDIRINANSFDREREVNRHIGDYLLFWSGLFPNSLREDALIDPVRQGQHSYYVVSTFDHGKYAPEAPTFRRLSEEFEACQTGLSLIRTKMPGLFAS